MSSPVVGSISPSSVGTGSVNSHDSVTVDVKKQITKGAVRNAATLRSAVRTLKQFDKPHPRKSSDSLEEVLPPLPRAGSATSGN